MIPLGSGGIVVGDLCCHRHAYGGTLISAGMFATIEPSGERGRRKTGLVQFYGGLRPASHPPVSSRRASRHRRRHHPPIGRSARRQRSHSGTHRRGRSRHGCPAGPWLVPPSATSRIGERRVETGQVPFLRRAGLPDRFDRMMPDLSGGTRRILCGATATAWRTEGSAEALARREPDALDATGSTARSSARNHRTSG